MPFTFQWLITWILYLVSCIWTRKLGSTLTKAWWRHQMETFSALLDLCEGIHPWPQKASDAEVWFFYPRLNKRSGKPSRHRWLETPLGSLWRHCNGGPIRYLSLGRSPAVGVTKAPFVNFSVSKIFDPAKVPVRLFASHSYLTGVTAAELRQHLSIMNVIFKK